MLGKRRPLRRQNPGNGHRLLSGGLTNSRVIVQDIEQIVRRQGWLPWGVPVFRHAERTDLSVSMGLLKEMCEYGRD